MHQLSIPVPAELAEALELHFCEEYQSHWMLFENEKLHTHELRGYFADETEARREYSAIREAFSQLPSQASGNELEDKDWKDAYKLHFKSWNDRGIHFVPVWERESYPLPQGDQIVLLDPGMAFGTGNHETTRLCLRRVIDARDAWGKAVVEKTVLDAGCGSGILAIAAAKAGFGRIHGFDNDPDSVRISIENAELCDVAHQVDFAWKGIEEGLVDRSADLVLANILAPILMDHAEQLVRVVNPGGILALSGILAVEVETVQSCFEPVAQATWGALHVNQRIDGEWADLLLKWK